MNLIFMINKIILKLAGKEIHTEEVVCAVSKVSKDLIKASVSDRDEVLKNLDSSLQGLDPSEVLNRRKKYGINEVAHEKAPPWYSQLMQATMNPFVGILVLLAIASFITEYVFAIGDEKDLTAVIIISILVLISILLTFFQEYKANQAAEKLLSLIQNKTIAERKGKGRHDLVTTELVPGDIIYLGAGDIIPGDVRILKANNLSVNEAPLTGESLPIEKTDSVSAEKDAVNALDLLNIGFMGTDIVSGTATAIVLSTGNNTYFGSMSKELVGHHPPTSFDLGVRDVSLLLIKFMAIMVPIIFMISGFVQSNWIQALLFGLAVAVGLTPEMLPTIITANLAKGTIEMAGHKTIIKRLNAIQNLGAMNILCTDKTGTLTHDTVAMEACLNIDEKPDMEVLKNLYLNSYYQTGMRNPLDEAVLNSEDSKSIEGIRDEYSKINEIPFQTIRRRMSVIVQDRSGKISLICKGAVEELIASSSYVWKDGENIPLNDEMKDHIRKSAERMNDSGLRVLLIAVREIEFNKDGYGPEDENNLVLKGLVGFLDPPKETAGPAIKALQKLGISVRVITGDNEIATRRICREINFEIAGLLQGHEIDKMTEEELSRAVEENNVFVRTAPLQKSRILNALKGNGHTVGFLGDGINDAPALRDADVGISVDNAVDIAKESAEIILLEKSLMILEDGVKRGRIVFGNIMKYIKMTVSSNFGNVFSVLIASIFIPFAPMLPLHLLVQNLLYDFSQISIPWDTVDEEYKERPQKWNPKSILRFSIYIGPVSSIFDFTMFALLWFIFKYNTSGQESFFHTGWFILGLVSQTMIVHLIRTRKIPFFESTAAKPVLIMTSLVMIIGLILPFTPIGSAIGFETLPLSYFFWLFLTLIAYCIAIQGMKMWYIKRFNAWL